MIQAVIIDDERNNIDNLEGLLHRYCPQVQIAGTAMNADDGAALIRTLKPDLVFLDIQMPGKNGFQMLQELPVHSFEIILITAFDQYGIQAIKFSAVDYLLKPLNIDELRAAVQKAERRIREKMQNRELENLLQLIRNREERSTHKLALSTVKETRFVHPKEIVRCESSNAYTFFFLNDGTKITVSHPIFEYEELLADYGFVRCHQSHLVNKSHIRSWVKEDGGYLALENGDKIPVSKSKKEYLAKMLIHLK
ncbi:LytR/AlgR family response regulator transcription factor [Niabella drilacis]|uniref:Two component transcriptional regulator, LytTR family n=1 Tax=Niabella drilacis (strain DSM 25811 / CCM 8410 / CCUG 62505 / LMG 26954 / E90) TaxID=1285928 RepID=A0A1G6XZK2_NIADE|nr:LytTR family DNA-binding domain-containing protein [Niabella drilacis]SDD82805.1 two component transcriptional regulator, LytTR family [Niabella drilacis]